ncbi:hypothetical protein [uncultured Tenacibaculum sp.]|uniref:hypothetical protein n=1 Tax=uncultured Tenacibaculum sp. TaxID=174713 RepID=UPI002612FB61|nr:hypothetical protein [uncultured Tenacibaculum sp.]
MKIMKTMKILSFFTFILFFTSCQDNQGDGLIKKPEVLKEMVLGKFKIKGENLIYNKSNKTLSGDKLILEISSEDQAKGKECILIFDVSKGSSTYLAEAKCFNSYLGKITGLHMEADGSITAGNVHLIPQTTFAVPGLVCPLAAKVVKCSPTQAFRLIIDPKSLD